MAGAANGNPCIEQEAKHKQKANMVMNQVANRNASTALAGLSQLKQGLQNVQTSINTPGGDYLLRLVAGSWVYGAENIEVEDKSEWAVNPLSIMHGWIAWSDYKKKTNEVLNEVMVPCFQPLPPMTDLRDVTDMEGNKCEYSQQIAFQLQCMSGEDVGEQVRYKATSVGGMNASKELLGEIIKQLDTNDAEPCPVIALEVDSYQHKAYGKTFIPVFTIVDWIGMDDVKEPLKDEAPAEPEADVKQPETQATATRVRQRQADPAPAADGINDADRRAAIDAAMAETARTRATERQQAEPAPEPARRRRRA